MVTTKIRGAKLEVWADAPSEDALFNVVTRELDESADEILIHQTEFDKPSSKDFRLELVFNATVEEGLFVGETVAESIKKELRDFGKTPTVSYTAPEEE